MATYDVVNTAFGNIFSTLLPGANAQLDLVDSQDIQQGIQIRVGFHGEWKESLSELSGG
jgi:structural maintenance of chromosome 2